MNRRPGTTLIEVLVAVFVTAIGLLGVLALFPLGAVSMAQAIKDSRCAQIAANAFALAEALNVRSDPQVIGFPDRFTFQEPVPANPDGPGYPVFVDPIGLVMGSKGKFFPTGVPQDLAIPRVNVSFVGSTLPSSTQPNPAVRWFTLLDDVNFPKEKPVFFDNSVVRREGRYSWAYLLRRPRSTNSSIVDLTVVVYAGRPNVFGQGETAYTPVTFDPASSVVHVAWGPGQDKPAVRAGGWILDATKVQRVGQNYIPDPHGFFYRVVNVSDEGIQADGKHYVDLELQTRPKLGTSQGVLVVLDGVAEVFEKGAGWRP
jgi:hypothetical protein